MSHAVWTGPMDGTWLCGHCGRDSATGRLVHGGSWFTGYDTVEAQPKPGALMDPCEKCKDGTANAAPPAPRRGMNTRAAVSAVWDQLETERRLSRVADLEAALQVIRELVLRIGADK